MHRTTPVHYLFLDTEWADQDANKLVSLALVSDDGQHRFYAEIDPLPKSPTSFVQATVYPLLERGQLALPEKALADALEKFLAAMPYPVFVLFDHANDGRLFEQMLSKAEHRGRLGPSNLVLTKMLRDGNFTRYLEGWFVAHPTARKRRHHAAVDAEALRQAWLAVTGRIKPTWAPMNRPG